MRQAMQSRMAAAFMLAAGLLAGSPAGAADVSTDTPTPPATMQTFASPRPALPPSPSQRMAESVGGMSQQIERDIGAIYPGEDTLGAGTSITH